MTALGVEVAEEAVLPAAEREERHRGGDADVDADIAGAGLVPELPRGGATAGEEAGHVAVGPVVDESDRLFNGLRVHQAENGSKDLRARGLATRVHLIQERRVHEVAVLIALDLLAAAIHHRP